MEVEIAEHDDDISIREGDANAATKVSEIRKADFDAMQREVQILQSKVQTLQNRLDAHLVRNIEKADLVGDEGRLEVEIAEHDDDISICEGDKNAATKVHEIQHADCDAMQREAGPDHQAEPTPIAEPSRPRPRRSASHQPADFCARSSRWRDSKGRFCRAPSPAH